MSVKTNTTLVRNYIEMLAMPSSKNATTSVVYCGNWAGCGEFGTLLLLKLDDLRLGIVHKWPRFFEIVGGRRLPMVRCGFVWQVASAVRNKSVMNFFIVGRCDVLLCGMSSSTSHAVMNFSIIPLGLN